MEKAQKNVKDFMKKNGIDEADINMEETSTLFLEEMEKGLKGGDSSLAMLPTYIETGRQIPRNNPVIVMDAGGTNFRTATVFFNDDGDPIIENFKKYSMPGIKVEVSKQEFFNIIARYIEDVLDDSGCIGFCFSYPLEMSPDNDGKVLYFSKEIQASEVVGEMMGENLNLGIDRLGHNGNKHVILLNDTVATLLAGRADAQRVYDSYIGFILGTGTNCSYVERNKNITKIQNLDFMKNQIVNIESGAFGKGPRGTIDRELDESSVSPGVNVFEKMISGAYLGPICLRAIIAACRDGLFSSTQAMIFKKIQELSTKDVSDFMCHPEKGRNPISFSLKDSTDEDIQTVYYLLDRMIERAAKLAAINLSAVAIKSEKGHNPCHPICIVAEGTTFYELKSLKTRIKYYLKNYLENKHRRYYEIVKVEDATLIGAAIAGLTN